MAIDTNELRRLAQEAIHPVTKGRWMRLFGERPVYDRMEDGCRGIPVVSTPFSPPHPFEAACLDFIAAANPQAILELLDRLEAAEKSDAESLAMYRKARDERDALRAKLEATEEDRSRFLVEMGKLCAQCDALRLRIEAAEKERDELLAGFDEWLDKTKWVQQGVNEGMISAKYLGLHRADIMTSLLGEAEKERDALRARVEAMERQEPVGWQTRTRPAWNDGAWGPWCKCSEEDAEDIKKTPLLHDWLYEARALYTLPGAKGEEK